MVGRGKGRGWLWRRGRRMKERVWSEETLVGDWEGMREQAQLMDTWKIKRGLLIQEVVDEWVGIVVTERKWVD